MEEEIISVKAELGREYKRKISSVSQQKTDLEAKLREAEGKIRELEEKAKNMSSVVDEKTEIFSQKQRNYMKSVPFPSSGF